MIKVSKFRIFENKKEWEQNYNKNWKLLCNCRPHPEKEPTLFPVAYEICITDGHCVNYIDMIPMEEAKQEIIKYCEENMIYFEKIINIIKQI